MSKRIFLLLILFVAAVAPAHEKAENWLEVRSPHFMVISNGSEKQARHVANQFERMRLVFHAEFPDMQVDPGTPIFVLAIKDEKGFRALEPEAYLGKGKAELDGLFMRVPDKNYVLLRLDAQGKHPYATIYHEYTHLILSKTEAWLPLWLNEGWAEFYQTTEIRANEVQLGLPSRENVLWLRQNRLLPLATLFAVDRDSPYYHEESKSSIFYAESWALTHYLMVNGGQREIQNYFHLVSRNVDSVTAGTRAFGDLKELQTALEQYVGQAAFNYASPPISTKVDDNAFNVQVLSTAQAEAVRADFLAYNERIADARALLDEALRDDPNNALARETMGYLEFRQGRLDEARKWYEQAVKLDSQSFLAHYYFAAISMNRGQLNVDDETQVESSLRSAIKLNPSFAPSYDRLAVFYGMRSRNLEEARTLALTAVQLDLGNVGYRLNEANILLAMQRGKEAVAVLRNTLKLAKSPAEVSSVQNTLQAAEYQAVREQMEEAKREASQGTQNDASESQPSASGKTSNAVPSTWSPQFSQRSDDPSRGPRGMVNGTLRNVRCSSPAVIELTVEGGGGTFTLHSNNYFKIQLSAANFTLTGELQPCTDFEGMAARVGFFELTGK